MGLGNGVKIDKCSLAIVVLGIGMVSAILKGDISLSVVCATGISGIAGYDMLNKKQAREVEVIP